MTECAGELPRDGFLPGELTGTCRSGDRGGRAVRHRLRGEPLRSALEGDPGAIGRPVHHLEGRGVGLQQRQQLGCCHSLRQGELRQQDHRLLLVRQTRSRITLPPRQCHPDQLLAQPGGWAARISARSRGLGLGHRPRGRLRPRPVERGRRRQHRLGRSELIDHSRRVEQRVIGRHQQPRDGQRLDQRLSRPAPVAPVDRHRDRRSEVAALGRALRRPPQSEPRGRRPSTELLLQMATQQRVHGEGPVGLQPDEPAGPGGRRGGQAALVTDDGDRDVGRHLGDHAGRGDQLERRVRHVPQDRVLEIVGDRQLGLPQGAGHRGRSGQQRGTPAHPPRPTVRQVEQLRDDGRRRIDRLAGQDGSDLHLVQRQVYRGDVSRLSRDTQLLQVQHR